MPLPRAKSECQVLKIPKYPLDCDVPSPLLRRAGPLTNYVLYVVLKALQDAQLSKDNLDNTKFIFNSPQDPSRKVERYIQKLVTFGEVGASPIMFSTSIHNASTSFISQTFNLIGPSSTISNMELSLASSIELATLWLEGSIVDRVIVVSGDEICHYDAYDFHQRKISTDQETYDPLSLDHAICGEAVIGMVLEKPHSQNNIGKAMLRSRTGLTMEDVLQSSGIIDAKGGYRLEQENDLYEGCTLNHIGKFIGSTPSVCCADLTLALEKMEQGNLETLNLFQVTNENIAAKISVQACP